MRLPNGYGSVVKMSGHRRNPYMVRKTTGWHYDAEKDKQVQDFIVIGYAKTKAEGLKMLAEYNQNPYDVKAAKMTFSDVYNEWSKKKFPTISVSNVRAYTAAYYICSPIYDKPFKNLRLIDLQQVIDSCDKNYPILEKTKVLFSQLYKFAIKNEICDKDYSSYVEVSQYKGRNPNKVVRDKFEDSEIDLLWENQDDKFYQTVLMLIYSGTRVSELLDLKKSDVYLDDHYFDVVKSKTENGVRKVPIADKTMPFFRSWYDADPDSEYLLRTDSGNHFTYDNYYKNYYAPRMKELGINRTPHCTRHTCISLLAEAGVDSTIIKKIVGHSGAMSLTERVYTHLDVQVLVDAINKI